MRRRWPLKVARLAGQALRVADIGQHRGEERQRRRRRRWHRQPRLRHELRQTEGLRVAERQSEMRHKASIFRVRKRSAKQNNVSAKLGTEAQYCRAKQMSEHLQPQLTSHQLTEQGAT